jgi:hypothetical protein
VTLCDRIASRSMALVSMPPDDLERVAAEEHAATCTACARALRQGGQLLRLVTAELRPEPSAEALRRAERSVIEQMDREARAAPARTRLLGAAGAALAFLALVASARHVSHDPVSWLVACAAASLAALLAALAPEGLRTAAGALGASVALALLASSTGGLHAAIGIKCLAFELACALLPFGFFAVARGAVPRPVSPGAAAALAASAALAGQAALHLTCPVHDALPHLFAFHFTGVALAALLGARIQARRLA